MAGESWVNRDGLDQESNSHGSRNYNQHDDRNWRNYGSQSYEQNSSFDDRRPPFSQPPPSREYRPERSPPRRERDYYPSERRDTSDWRRERSQDYDGRRRSPPSRRSRSPPRRSERANNKIMMTSVPEHVDRDSMNIIVSRHGFCPVDIRVIHKVNDNGVNRAFGFIDFNTVDEARNYMRYTQGILQFDDKHECRLEYAREQETPNSREPRTGGSVASSDWMCAKCHINNFNRRSACFKCGTSKRDSDNLASKGYNMVGSEPCDTLLVRELPATANELSILQAFSAYTNIPIQRVHIGTSHKYCLLQMRSMEEASYMLQTFNRNIPQINNCVVIVSYARHSLNKILLNESVESLKSQTGVTSTQVQQDPTNSAAMLAYNALQISKIGRVPTVQDRQTISTPLGVFPTYTKPDSRTFQLEPSTGYFYDQTTGFYYDPKTDYYYDPASCQWCFWTTEFSTYIPCTGEKQEVRAKLQQNEKTLKEQATAATSEDKPEQKPGPDEEQKKKKKKEKEDDESNKPKTAQDIQREMNKWAKRQEKIKMSFKKDEAPGKTTESKAFDPDDEEAEPPPQQQMSISTSINDLNEPAPVHLLKRRPTAAFDPAQYLDLARIACLLCQRQFKSRDVLDKHCQKSDLHKKNVADKMAELGMLTPNASSSINFEMPIPQYRDRAKERRQLHGLDPGLDEQAHSETNLEEEASRKATAPIDDTNIGSKLLKNMGWTEGTGLGKNKQGIVNPIAADRRAQGVGLGASGSRILTGVSRKDQIKQATMARYQDLQEREDQQRY